MNRVEFMAQLERLLFDLPENERQDALCYYNDYFDDAGEENEGDIIQELGSPGKVAAIIRSSYRGGAENRGEYTENGYRDTQFSDNRQMPDARKDSDGGKQEERRSWWEEQRDKRKNSNTDYSGSESQSFHGESSENSNSHPYQEGGWNNQGNRRRGPGGWVLIILALIFIGPPVLGIGAGAFGVLFGLLGAVLSLMISGFALAGAGVVGIVKGALLAATSPATGLVAIGGGLIIFALGLLVILLFSWLLFKVLPKAVRGLINFFSRLLHHGRGRDEGGAQD